MKDSDIITALKPISEALNKIVLLPFAPAMFLLEKARAEDKQQPEVPAE